MSVIVIGSALAVAVLLFAFFYGTLAARRQPKRRNGAGASIWSGDGGATLSSSVSDGPCDSGSSDGGGGCDGGGGGD